MFVQLKKVMETAFLGKFAMFLFLILSIGFYALFVNHSRFLKKSARSELLLLHENWKLQHQNEFDLPGFKVTKASASRSSTLHFSFDDIQRLDSVLTPLNSPVYYKILHQQSFSKQGYRIIEGNIREWKEDGNTLQYIYEKKNGIYFVSIHDNIRSYGELLSIILVLTGIIFSFLVFMYRKFIREFFAPIKYLAGQLEDVLQGKPLVKLEGTQNPEIESVYSKVELVSREINRVVDAQLAMAIGNWSYDVYLDDDSGVLRQTTQKLMQSLNTTLEQIRRIVDNQLDVKIVPKSEDDVLSKTLNELLQQLNSVKSKNQFEHWMKSGIAELNDKIRGELSKNVVAENVLSFVVPYVEGSIGAIYYKTDDNYLSRIAHYSWVPGNGGGKDFKLGEGTIGQVGLQQEPIILRDIENEFVTVNTGMLEVGIRNVVIYPLIDNFKLIGVIEIGKADTLLDAQIDFIKQISTIVAITIESANSREHVNALLEQTQNLAYTMEQQQISLSNTNSELESQKAELEKRQEVVKGKNMELERIQKELEIKADEFEKASAYKSEFLANMSHELRTPLNSILILSKILTENKEKNLTTTQEEFVRTIHTAGSDLLELINDILDLSKVESGKMEVYFEDMDIRKTVQKLESYFVSVAQSKNLKFKISIDASVPDIINTDEQKVEQIMKNFLSNAFKFTQEGSIELRVGISIRDEKNYVILSVEDTGTGIEEDKKQKVFDAFTQADGTISRKFGGTGLGLSISLQMSKMVNGFIDFDSTLNVGSCFSLYLPLSCLLEDRPVPQDEIKYKQIVYREDDESHILLYLGNNLVNQEVLESLVGELQHCKLIKVRDESTTISTLYHENVSAIVVDEGYELPQFLDSYGIFANFFREEEKIFIIHSSNQIEGVDVKDLMKCKNEIADIINDSNPEIMKPPAVVAEKNILVVDDDMRNIFAFTKFLEEEGANVVVAKKMEEVSKVAQEGQMIEAIILNCAIKGCSVEGIDAIRDQVKGVSIIGFTSNNLNANESIKDKVDEFLYGPVEEKQFKAIIYKWIVVGLKNG